jgi:hypothetical protein
MQPVLQWEITGVHPVVRYQGFWTISHKIFHAAGKGGKTAVKTDSKQGISDRGYG